MADPTTRFDIYRSVRDPARFLTVPEGVAPRQAISRDSGIQVLDFLLYAAHARIDAIAGFRCDAEAVRRDCERQGFAHHRGLATVASASSSGDDSITGAEALLRRAAVLRERTAAWRRQLDEHGEGWDGYCPTLAAVISLEERAQGLEARAWMVSDQGWAA